MGLKSWQPGVKLKLKMRALYDYAKRMCVISLHRKYRSYRIFENKSQGPKK